MKFSAGRRKNILFVELNQDGTTGGSHHSLLHLVRCLDKTLYNPTVMFYEKNKLLPEFSAEGASVKVFRKPLGSRFEPPVPVLKVPARLIRKTWNRFSTSLAPFFYFFLFLLKHRIDLVHLNNTARAGWEWLIACKLLNKKCITHERGFARYTPVAIAFAKRFDRIICISEAVRDAVLQQGLNKNVTMIYNATDPAAFRGSIVRDPQDVKREFGVPDAAPLIGMVGNIQEWKGHRTVVEAMQKLREDLAGLRCLLVGDASSTVRREQEFLQSLKRQITENELARHVILTGYRTDIADLMNAMDIVLHASVQPEPFGRVVLEAMSLGKPVIATDIGGPREIIKNGVSGFLVPPGDPIVLADTIKRLLSDAGLRADIGKNALKTVEERFTLGRFRDELHSLYQELFSDAQAGLESTGSCTTN